MKMKKKNHFSVLVLSVAFMVTNPVPSRLSETKRCNVLPRCQSRQVLCFLFIGASNEDSLNREFIENFSASTCVKRNEGDKLCQVQEAQFANFIA